MDLAYQNGAPIIGMNNSGGARIQGDQFSGGLWGNFYPQCALFGRDPADFHHSGAVRRWGGLFARHHRFCVHGG